MILDDFLVRAALAGIGVAIAAAPLGCFVIWRRMAYFGDATAHAAILGVALAIATSLPIIVGVLLVALTMAVIVSQLSGRGYAVDTLLGVISHAALAFGLVAVSLAGNVRINLESFLFGDILAVNRLDILIIWTAALLVVGLLYMQWNALFTSTLSPDLARSVGFDPRRSQLILMVSLAIVVAVSIKIVGALLITAMLIIPAAAARSLAKTPEQMAVFGALIGAFSVIGGMWAAFYFDTPAGPTIVCAAATFFFVINVGARVFAAR